MSAVAFENVKILMETGVRESSLIVRDGLIAEIGRSPGHDCETIDCGGQILAPGFIDIQVNGGGGVLFNDDPSVATITKIAHAHRAFGTTSFLPTLISDDEAKIAQAISAADQAIAEGVPGVLGVHIEGPFLNAAKRGIHDETKIRKMTDDVAELLTSARRARVVVTLAPECVAERHIRLLTEAGVKVCAGHSNATYEQTKAAIEGGVKGFTHLFNAMSPMQSRAPGMVPAALESDGWCGIIVDGHHVHPAMLQLAWRAKADRRFLLVTDAMPMVGSDQDFFYLGTRRIVVKGGACRAEDGTLAGAALTMNDAFINAVSMMGVDATEASMMASGNPAAFLDLAETLGSIALGQRADLVLLSDEMRVLETWIGGVRLHADLAIA